MASPIFNEKENITIIKLIPINNGYIVDDDAIRIINCESKVITSTISSDAQSKVQQLPLAGVLAHVPGYSNTRTD